MDINLRNKLNELYVLLDNYDVIKLITEQNKRISNDIFELVQEYRKNPILLNKRKLLQSREYCKYLQYEKDINVLIIAINKKFRLKEHCCAHH